MSRQFQLPADAGVIKLLKQTIILSWILFTLLLPYLALADIEIHFLDVGQGDATIILCDSEVMMIDGGGSSGSQMIYSYLKELEIQKIDQMVLTHPHSDHCGGLAAALTACEVGRVYTPVYYTDDSTFLTFRDMLADRNLPFIMPLAGTSTTLGGANISFLAPYRLYGDNNDNSIMLRITYKNCSFLFTGDAEIPEEHEVLERNDSLAADVLKIGHHGSSSSSCREFLEAVSPQIALIGVGVGNTYGHPSLEVLSCLQEMQTKVYRTDLHGTIVLRCDGESIDVTTAQTVADPDLVYTLSWASLTEVQSDEDHPAAEYYVGNRSSMRFHLPDCEGAVKMNEKNRVILDTRQDAIEQGYKPCGTCKP